MNQSIPQLINIAAVELNPATAVTSVQAASQATEANTGAFSDILSAAINEANTQHLVEAYDPVLMPDLGNFAMLNPIITPQTYVEAIARHEAPVQKVINEHTNNIQLASTVDVNKAIQPTTPTLTDVYLSAAETPLTTQDHPIHAQQLQDVGKLSTADQFKMLNTDFHDGKSTNKHIEKAIHTNTAPHQNSELITHQHELTPNQTLQIPGKPMDLQPDVVTSIDVQTEANLSDQTLEEAQSSIIPTNWHKNLNPTQAATIHDKPILQEKIKTETDKLTTDEEITHNNNIRDSEQHKPEVSTSIVNEHAANKFTMNHVADSYKPYSNITDQNIGEQVEIHIHKALTDGQNKITIQLHPAELGKLEIQLNLNRHGETTVNITAEKLSTLELLRSDILVLERNLENTGITADGGLSINLSLGQSNHNNSQNSNDHNEFQLFQQSDDITKQYTQLKEVRSYRYTLDANSVNIMI